MLAYVRGTLKPVYARYRCAKSRWTIRTLLARQAPIFLELGAGNRTGRLGWTTVDVTRRCDIYWDMRKGIPFPDECVSKIYSSHFLEHLTFQDAQSLLDECLRVLKPGGSFSVCVPNARKYLEAYLNDDPTPDALFDYPPARNCTTKIDLVNYIAYMDGHHRYMFDEENVLHILEARGMRNARLRDFEDGLDLRERDFCSIYAVAEK